MLGKIRVALSLRVQVSTPCANWCIPRTSLRFQNRHQASAFENLHPNWMKTDEIKLKTKNRQKSSGWASPQPHQTGSQILLLEHKPATSFELPFPVGRYRWNHWQAWARHRPAAPLVFTSAALCHPVQGTRLSGQWNFPGCNTQPFYHVASASDVAVWWQRCQSVFATSSHSW